MESRKHLLQKQIIEALRANDHVLYSLLKSQWAHRFGVESLDELKNLDLEDINQNPSNLDEKKIERPKEDLINRNQPISSVSNDHKEKEIKSKYDPNKDKINKSFTNNSNKLFDRETNDKKAKKITKDVNNESLIQVLIPLPPKPKYGYLKKWLLKK